jgi:hypothetical protein
MRISTTSPAVWTIAFSLMTLVQAGCDERDKDKNGEGLSETGGGGSGGISGGGGDSDSDVDGGIDGGAMDAGPTTCVEGDVRQPGTDLCWRRCPLGQEERLGGCDGNVARHTWVEAIAECSLLGGGYRNATRSEMVALLGDCDKQVLETAAEGVCASCGQSEPCEEMFVWDHGVYWTSTDSNTEFDSDLDPDPAPWAVSFYVGTVFVAASAKDLYEVRCVRDL